jgi:hypothetical protein
MNSETRNIWDFNANHHHRIIFRDLSFIFDGEGST